MNLNGLFGWLDYLIYLVQSSNRHGVHSPFVYDFADKVLYRQLANSYEPAAELCRKRMLQSDAKILLDSELKEISLSLLNGAILAAILFLGSYFLLGVEPKIGMIVTIALVSVIIIASLIGTFIPLLLDKLGIDPALATGPFITTSNDICGILIYFSIAKLILGF